jgi:hypothetical protein
MKKIGAAQREAILDGPLMGDLQLISFTAKFLLLRRLDYCLSRPPKK